MHMLIAEDLQEEISARSDPTLVQRNEWSEIEASAMEGVTSSGKLSDPDSPCDRPAKRHRAGVD
jgi:hypothetical protein